MIGFLIAGLAWFIQSPSFAQVVKRVASKYIPADIGIEGDFSEFTVKLFPPGISIQHPKVTVGKHNIVNLPPGSSVVADRVDLNFRFFQMFSGNIRIHEVVVVNGDVRLVLGDSQAAQNPKLKKAFKPDFHWDELFQIHAEAVALENTRLHLETAEKSATQEFYLDLLAENLRLGQWSGHGGLGYEIELELSDIHASFLKSFPLAQNLGKIHASAHINALGMLVDSIDLKSTGLDFRAAGTVRGNILNPKGLVVESTVKINGDVEKALEIAGVSPKVKTKFNADGIFNFNGRMKCNLDDIVGTMKADGVFAAKKLRFMAWKADSVQVEGGWIAGPRGGDISISKAEIVEHELPRIGGNQPGDGGKIQIGGFSFPIALFLKASPGIEPSVQSIQIPLKLERAHIHWLAAVALKDVYPLDFRATGDVQATFNPPTDSEDWSIQAKLGLGVAEFRLDNQRLGKDKPMHGVLKVPKIQLTGDVTVDPSGVAPDVNISLPNTKLHVVGTIGSQGYDLKGNGAINLKDIGEIAENPIQGTGTLEASVHGPSSRVFIDFDTDLKDAYYLNLELGDLKGRITWDDDPQYLIFKKVVCTKGRSTYIGDGMFDLGQKDTVDLKVSIPTGNIQDMTRVFDPITKALFWFPRSLNGPVTGDVKIFGGLGMDQLKIATRLNGTNWEFVGERFRTVTLIGGYDRGKYYISDLRAIKNTGAISANISYDQNKVFDWDFRTREFTLADVSHLAQLDVPIRGRISVDSKGNGTEELLKSSTTVALSEMAIRGVGVPPSQIQLKTDGQTAVIKGTALGGQGTIDSYFDFRPESVSTVQASLKHFDFSPVLLLLNPKLLQDRALIGLISGEIGVNFHAGKMDRLNGKVDISEYNLSKTGTSFVIDHPVSVKMTDGSFDVSGFVFKGGQGNTTLNLTSRKGVIDGKIAGDLDLSIVEFLTSSVESASGLVDLDYSIGGSLAQPTVFGKAIFNGDVLKIPSLETPFENVTGSFILRQNVLTFQSIQSDLAGGRVSADGSITLFTDRYPSIGIKGFLSGNKLKVYPFQTAKVHGNLSVHGDDLPYVIDGNIIVESALSKEKVFNQKKTDALKAVRYTPLPTVQGETDYPKFKLNIGITGDSKILVQNDLFDAELKGKLTLVNTLDAPRVLGNVDLIQGKLIFKDRSFVIQSANASFDSPTVINPLFNLISTTDVNGTKIQLAASGRLDKWKPELTSNPVMSESEILSLPRDRINVEPSQDV